MKYLKTSGIPTHGVALSRIGLGGMRIGADAQEGISAIHTALDSGITFLNTADFYQQGRIEMLFKEALSSRKREDVFISVKFGAMFGPDDKLYGVDNRPEHIKNYLAYSLKRLGTDYVDLYQPARHDPNIPVEEIIGAIADMVKAGYVRNIGISEVDGQTLRRAYATHPISLAEVRYSLMDRHIEDDLLPVARELGVGVVAFGVLLSGLIGGSAPQEKLSAISNAVSSSSLASIQHNISQTDLLKAIADKKGITLAQLAIAWVLAQGEDILALVGSRTVAQVKDTMKALDIHLDKEELRLIEEIIPKAQANSSYMKELNLDKNGLIR